MEAKIDKISNQYDTQTSYDPFMDRNNRRLEDYHIKCVCGIPPCIYPNQTLISLIPRLQRCYPTGKHCAKHCHPSLDNINDSLDKIVNAYEKNAQIAKGLDAFAPLCSLLMLAAYFVPLIQSSPTLLLQHRYIDPRLSEQLTPTLFAQIAAEQAAQVPRVNRAIYSLVRPFESRATQAAGMVGLVGILTACYSVLRAAILENAALQSESEGAT